MVKLVKQGNCARSLKDMGKLGVAIYGITGQETKLLRRVSFLKSVANWQKLPIQLPELAIQ